MKRRPTLQRYKQCTTSITSNGSILHACGGWALKKSRCCECMLSAATPDFFSPSELTEIPVWVWNCMFAHVSTWTVCFWVDLFCTLILTCNVSALYDFWYLFVLAFIWWLVNLNIPCCFWMAFDWLKQATCENDSSFLQVCVAHTERWLCHLRDSDPPVRVAPRRLLLSSVSCPRGRLAAESCSRHSTPLRHKRDSQEQLCRSWLTLATPWATARLNFPTIPPSLTMPRLFRVTGFTARHVWLMRRRRLRSRFFRKRPFFLLQSLNVHVHIESDCSKTFFLPGHHSF